MLSVLDTKSLAEPYKHLCGQQDIHDDAASNVLPIATLDRDWETKVLLIKCTKVTLLSEAKNYPGYKCVEDGKNIIHWGVIGFWSHRYKNWNDGVEPSGLSEPTHWMPLPEPPEEIKND